MPNYKDETQQYHMERVRAVMAMRPRSSIVSIREALSTSSHDPITLDRVYIAKIVKKIKGERKYRFNQALVDEHIAEMEDEFNQLGARMWATILNPASGEKERISAARTIIDARDKLFAAKMDGGIFERQLGTVKVERGFEVIVHHAAPHEATRKRSRAEVDRHALDKAPALHHGGKGATRAA